MMIVQSFIVQRLGCLTLWAGMIWALVEPLAAEDPQVKVGSKSFTESVILGELLGHIARSESIPAEHRSELGGTQVLWKALLAGEIDMYVEYTGTLREEILDLSADASDEEIKAKLIEQKVGITPHLGFNNTYAVAIPSKLATAKGLKKISDLKNHPELRLGFSDEFLDRADGWPGLQAAYQLPHSDVRGLDHVMACRGLNHGSLDVTDIYSTDAEIEFYNLTILEDDLRFFPKYYAVVLYRNEVAERYPKLIEAIHGLDHRISNEQMKSLNAAVRGHKQSELDAAGDFATQQLGLKLEWTRTDSLSWYRRIISRLVVTTSQHLVLVVISLLAAVSVSIPLGIIAYLRPRAENSILGIIGIIQTLPSMALLVFMIPLLGLGTLPAIVALFLYSLLPIVRGTYSGLKQIPEPLRESAEVLGLTPWRRLMKIELPLASPSIMSGIKTAAVINIGTATIGALIGAGGYGQPILTGIRLADIPLILQGAIPAAAMAILVQSLFGWFEFLFVPAGLRK
jgi:osmoprotectant transport system permease protein